jgi:ornithine cyclodeaminase/alanine dehydrogenase-like protein (mu-crystallin family)
VPPSEQHPRVKKIPALADGRFTEFIMMFDAEDGRLLAILPDGHIQRTRVALTHALAAKYLARRGATTLGLFGSGWQASAQAEILAGILNLERIRIFSPNEQHRTRFAEKMRAKLQIDVTAVARPEDVMRGADIVIGATNATSVVIRAPWAEEGMHISSVRSRAEIDPALLVRADRIVVHNRTDSIDHWCGALPPGLIDKKHIVRRSDHPELADIVGAKAAGRSTDRDITLFVDGDHAGGPGLGIQFAAVCRTVYDAARRRGVGRELPIDWFVDREDHPGGGSAEQPPAATAS